MFVLAEENQKLLSEILKCSHDPVIDCRKAAHLKDCSFHEKH